MGRETNLRALRLRYHISVRELAVCAGLCRQYVSRAELGEIAATARLEAQMAAAMERIISARKTELQALETDYLTYKGCLLREEDDSGEQ